MERPNLAISNYKKIVESSISPPTDGFILLGDHFNWLYENLISPNATLFTIVIVVIIFLTSKYYLAKIAKEYRKKHSEEFSELSNDIDILIENHETDKYHQNKQPVINVNQYYPKYNNESQMPQTPLPNNYDSMNNHSSLVDYNTPNTFIDNSGYTSQNILMNNYMQQQLKEGNQLEQEMLMGREYIPPQMIYPDNVEAPYN